MYLLRLIAIAVGTMMIFCGCSATDTNTESTLMGASSSSEDVLADPVVKKIEGSALQLEAYSFRMSVGETKRIVIDTLPTGFQASDLSFLSDNTKAVQVKDDGTVVGIQNGAATIGVSLAGTATRATVTVIVSNK